MEKAETETVYESQIPVEMTRQRKTPENVCLRIIYFNLIFKIDSISRAVAMADTDRLQIIPQVNAGHYFRLYFNVFMLGFSLEEE
ncbi:MAG: hypothetical protein IH909_08140 [Proteobacteria bacterium]|nr:hypothetical protein [Pseudomonadota bacterium]